MVELTLECVEETGLPQDCFISIRIGDAQKLSRLSQARVFRFPQVTNKHCVGKVEVFRRIGTSKFDVDPAHNGGRDVKVNCADANFGSLGLKIGIGGEDVAKKKVEEGERLKATAVKEKAAWEYMAKHGLQLQLSDAMQAVLQARPEKPAEFIAARLLAASGAGCGPAPVLQMKPPPRVPAFMPAVPPSALHTVPFRGYYKTNFQGALSGAFAQLHSSFKANAAARAKGNAKHILCTGGAGYVGSHTVVKLVEAGFKVTIVDNFSVASARVQDRLQQITGQPIPMLRLDTCHEQAVDRLFQEKRFDAVVHFAGFSSEAESIDDPMRYYESNVSGTVSVLKAMEKYGCNSFVFSSSAYHEVLPENLSEVPIGCANPYSQTGRMVEQVLQDACQANNDLKVSLLRCCNPCGAHPSGRIGKSPSGTSSDFTSHLLDVAAGRCDRVTVSGGDTVRDYVHVDDLADGHVCALKKIFGLRSGVIVHNLGSGRGVSMLAMVQAFKKATGKALPCQIVQRSPGDLPIVVASPAKAKAELGWEAKRSLAEIAETAWKWQSANPCGYGTNLRERVLCAGGAGYVGAHTVVKLVEAGYEVAIMDDSIKANSRFLERLREITGQDVPFFPVASNDEAAVDRLFKEQRFSGVVLFPGGANESETASEPMQYYDSAVAGICSLLKAMERNGCKALVLSSSAGVYAPSERPIGESQPLDPSTSAGRASHMMEQICRDVCGVNNGLAVALLRCFTPWGAHLSGRIGSSPSATACDLMSRLQQVAMGKCDQLSIDGTSVRDYVHVEDLAEGHVCALTKIIASGRGVTVHNLGSGKGVSELEMVSAFKQVSGAALPYQIVQRKPGDLATTIADPAKAKTELGWQAKRGLGDMMATTWKWQSENPLGYGLPLGERVLCTGGAGYVAAHTIVKLVESGYKVSIMDSRLTADARVLGRLKELTGEDIPFFRVDAADEGAVNALFSQQRFDAVMHLMGLEGESESCDGPMQYYESNVAGTVSILKAMEKHCCRTFVLSASDRVYAPSEQPINETSPVECRSACGRAQYMIEQILRDACQTNAGLRVSVLRCSSPCGAHPSGRIGASSCDAQTDFVYALQLVAAGKLDKLSISGSGSATKDGTCVRDYVHVDDLAEGHVCALKKLLACGRGITVHNMGSGCGASALEMIQVFQQVSRKAIAYTVAQRSPDDIPVVILNSSKAKGDLGWQPKRGLTEMAASSWKWQAQNPFGYGVARRQRVLCTGGAGFIGSHAVVKLVEHGYQVAIMDCSMRRSGTVLERLRELTGENLEFFDVDTSDEAAVDKIFREQRFDGVVHCAGPAAECESVEEPMQLYESNVAGTLSVLKAMEKNGCKRLVLSSSSSVYAASGLPVNEAQSLEPSSPFGWTKYMTEQILSDACQADRGLAVSVLRCFNPCGAHPSGRIGGTESECMPCLQQVGVRDYVHVEDLAEGHALALKKLFAGGCGVTVHNLGSGNGVSAADMTKAFQRASRRAVDGKATGSTSDRLVVANPAKARAELGWQAKWGLADIVGTAWKWQSQSKC